MNITLENIDAVNAVITAEIAPADYEEKVKKAIKDFRKKVNMPGFRRGMVPEGLVKKQYGPSILGEEVNKLLQEGLYNYIRENKVNMLGEPLPNDDNNDIELVEGNTFTFKFDLAIAPEINFSLTKKDKVDFYNVKVSDEMVNRQVEMYRQRGGSYEKVDDYQDNDMIKGVITELDKEDGINENDVVMLPKYFKNEAQKALFANAKVNDIIKFNPSEAYEGSETELASLLKVDKEKVAEHKGDFNFQITEITRYVKHAIDQELFDQTFGEGNVKSEKEFKEKIEANLKEQLAMNAESRFLADVRAYVEKKLGKVEYADSIMKRIMLANNKDKDMDYVEKNYEASLKELTWHLAKNQLLEQCEVKIEDADVKEVAKEMTRMQFAQYGMSNIPEEYIDNYAEEMLKKPEQVDQLVNQAADRKLMKALKEVVTLEEKKISFEDFNKLEN